MLNAILLEFRPQYLAINEFKNLEQFDAYYAKWWDKAKNEELEGILHADTGEEIDLSDKLLSDVSNIHLFIKNKYLISSLAPTISKAITKNQDLELQQALFNSFLSESDALQKQIESKVAILEKYPFILTELVKLRGAITMTCSHLSKDSTITTPYFEKIVWNGGVVAIASLFRKLIYEVRLPNKANPISPEQKDAVIRLIMERFSDKGEPFKEDSLRRGISSKKEAPGEYESYADMGLDEWIKIRIVAKDAHAQLFLNDNPQPSLVVNDLKHGPNSKGAIGLFVDTGTEGFFSDVKVIKEH